MLHLLSQVQLYHMEYCTALLESRNLKREIKINIESMAKTELEDRKSISGDKVEEILLRFRSKFENTEIVANFTEDQLEEEVNRM